MDDDSFARFVENSSSREAARSKENIEREVQVQLRARRTRMWLRRGFYSIGGFGLGSLLLGGWLEIAPLAVLGGLCILLSAGLGLVLMFKGGLAPGRYRYRLSEEDRKRADN